MSTLDEKILQQLNLAPAVAPALSSQSTPSVDSRFIKIETLPSNFIPYERKYLMARPFSILELKHIARSIETDNIDFITQAMQNCIDFDVYKLTIPDYFYLYYWFRIESYPHSPYYLEWTCDAVVGDTPCAHNNLSTLTVSELTTIDLKDLNFDSSTLDPRLSLPRVQVLEELMQANKDRKLYKDTKSDAQCTYKLEHLILTEAAKWVKEGNTLQEKLAILEQQPDLQLYELANIANNKFQYGVYEYTLVTCGGCGAKRRFRVTLDAPKFFPFID